MDSKFGVGLANLYTNVMAQGSPIGFAELMNAYAKATEAARAAFERSKAIAKANAANDTSLDTTQSPLNASLDSEIPREEIECDIEIILVKNFRDSLKKMQTNLNGYHGKKFGFREVIEIVSSRNSFPNSPSTPGLKRKRTLSACSLETASPLIKIAPQTPPTTDNEIDENESKKKRTDEASPSSSHGDLQIDCVEEKNEAPEEIKTVKVEPIEPVEQVESIDEDVCKPYDPVKLRVDRMRSIQTKKPKFNVDNLDLTYHSNMARVFPGSENRTEDQQNRRSKNTLAARISRTKNKAYEKMLESQSIDATTQNINMKRKVSCLRVYGGTVLKCNGIADTNFGYMWESNIANMAAHSE